jgi:hypothetical protein
MSFAHWPSICTSLGTIKRRWRGGGHLVLVAVAGMPASGRSFNQRRLARMPRDAALADNRAAFEDRVIPARVGFTHADLRAVDAPWHHRRSSPKQPGKFAGGEPTLAAETAAGEYLSALDL